MTIFSIAIVVLTLYKVFGFIRRNGGFQGTSLGSLILSESKRFLKLYVGSQSERSYRLGNGVGSFQGVLVHNDPDECAGQPVCCEFLQPCFSW